MDDPRIRQATASYICTHGSASTLTLRRRQLEVLTRLKEKAELDGFVSQAYAFATEIRALDAEIAAIEEAISAETNRCEVTE